jgi:hypothetical protein
MTIFAAASVRARDDVARRSASPDSRAEALIRWNARVGTTSPIVGVRHNV